MRRKNAGSLFALCIAVAGLVRADPNSVVVTNQAAANATATLTSNNGCFAYTFSGKVRPDFRTNGQTTVSLVCTQACVLQGTCDPQTVPGNLVFPQCTNTNLDVSSFCGGPVVTNSCG